MTCEYVPGLSGDEQVTLESRVTRTSVRLWNRARPWGDDGVRFSAEVGAADLRATIHEVTDWTRGNNLAGFLEELAESFTGWEGTRSWQTLDRDLCVDAVFRSGGHVEMTWTIQPWRPSVGRWSASVVVSVEAGEELRCLAADVYRFLHADSDD